MPAWNDKGFLEPKFLGSWDVPKNSTLVVRIKGFEMNKVKNHKTNREEDKFILLLYKYKPMICNITNAKLVTEALGTKEMNDWVGRHIEIQVKIVRSPQGMTPALRVKNEEPPSPPKPVFTPESARWIGAVKSVAENETTIESIKGKFNLSEEHEEQMKEEAMKYIENKQNYDNEQ